MKKQIFCGISLFWISLSAWADTLDTAPKTASEPNTISVSQAIDDEIARIWQQIPNTLDDIIVLPDASQMTTPIYSSPIGSRHQPPTVVTMHKKLPIAAKIVHEAAIIAKPVTLTRRQVIQQEIQREKLALNKVKNQLIAAQKTNNLAAIRQLTMQMTDRLQNVAALEAEMRR